MKITQFLFLSAAIMLKINVSVSQTSGSYDSFLGENLFINNSKNSAYLGLKDTLEEKGIAYFNYNHQSGDYHRVQEGGQTNSLKFFSEKFQNLGRFLRAYGTFQFDMGRTKDRAWCDVLRPYNSNPFISGSAISGKYDFQFFDLTGQISTIKLKKFTYGIGLDYKTGDFSRLKDPRSRIFLLDYKLTPSVTYSFSDNHTLGATFVYNRRKEKLGNITTVQSDFNEKYYQMSGLENAIGTIKGHSGYKREYILHDFGGEFLYNVGFENVDALLTGFFSKGTENIFGDMKSEPGKYFSTRYGFSLKAKVKTQNIHHQLFAKYSKENSYADEYLQKIVTTKNPDNGLDSKEYVTVLTYNKRYEVKLDDISAKYRISYNVDNKTVAFLGVGINTEKDENIHVVPDSKFRYKENIISFDAGGNFLDDKIGLNLGFSSKKSPETTLQLSDLTTDYAVNVLIPDMTFYAAKYKKYSASIEYRFTTNIENYAAKWFIKLYANYLKSSDKRDFSGVGISAGLYL